MDRAPEFKTRGSDARLARMIGGKDLNPWPDLGVVADRDLDDIQNDAVEVEEYAGTETDIETVIAVKWRSDNRTGPYKPEAFNQQRMPVGGGHVERGIVARKPSMGCR